MTAAETILGRLGGKMFVFTTRSHSFTTGEDSLAMKLAPNRSGANCLRIIHTPTGVCRMEFLKHTKRRVRAGIPGKEIGYKPERIEIVKIFGEVGLEQLREFFTEVTGLHIGFFD